MLSISEFSEVCQLPPQTLRFYHSEGLLVPAEVNEQTGYRSYKFEQVEQAMLITVLRGTGMSVKFVRRALDDPDAIPALLEQHSMEVQRQRQAQDEAFNDAREFVNSWPEAHVRHAPEVTVVSKLVPGPSVARHDRYDWNEADAAVAATVEDVVRTVESCGAVVSGTPWRAWAIETEEQKVNGRTAGGPHWLVKVPVTMDEEAVTLLPDDVEVQTFEAREELSIFIPGRFTNAKFGTALSHLIAYPFEAAYVDISSMRQMLHDNGVETTAAVRELDETDVVA